MKWIVLALPLWIVATSATASPAWADLDEGAVVRVGLCDSTVVEGRWLPGTPDSVRVRTTNGTRSAYEVHDTCRLEQRSGRATGWLKSGAILGAVAGTVLSAAVLQGGSDMELPGKALLTFLSISVGAGGGALVGGLIGGLVPEWEPVAQEVVGQIDPPN